MVDLLLIAPIESANPEHIRDNPNSLPTSATSSLCTYRKEAKRRILIA
jgi:hypothetical protein